MFSIGQTHPRWNSGSLERPEDASTSTSCKNSFSMPNASTAMPPTLCSKYWKSSPGLPRGKPSRLVKVAVSTSPRTFSVRPSLNTCIQSNRPSQEARQRVKGRLSAILCTQAHDAGSAKYPFEEPRYGEHTQYLVWIDTDVGFAHGRVGYDWR